MPGILMITTAFTTSFFKALGLSSVKYHIQIEACSLAEDAPTGRDLVLAGAVAAALAEGALSCKEPPADHLKETEAQERGGSGEEDDRQCDGEHSEV